MEDQVIWLSPLLILPGIGLLIVSTSSRYSSLHDEIHHWLDGMHDVAVIEQAHLVTRAAHFRNALVALYTSVFTFVSASVVGAVLDSLALSADFAVFAIAVLGIVAVGYASSELIRESLLSLQVINAHVKHIMQEMTNESASHKTDHSRTVG